jgi:putative membrane-bound dehydrogenase-like protein
MLRVGLFSLTVSLACAAETNRFTPDLTGFQLDPRLEIALWASEPDIVDPVSLCWDAAGRAYVAECRDYPYGVGPDGKAGSTVRLLEDTNGDGRPDKATVFASDLSYVTSVTPWRNGVLVTAAPDILFLADTNGDGVADVREVVVTGFQRGVSDSLVNGLRYGLDNRIHGANGGNGGLLHSPRRPDVSLKLGDDDFALNPDTGVAERTAESGGGFGLVFDDFGRAFTTYNINHLQHRFLSRRQVERFPGFPPTDLTGSISDHEEMSRIFPISTAQTRPNHPEQAGHFSAAGGMGLVGSGVFPDELRGSIFVCDVVGNLVHRDVIVPDGPVFRATRPAGEQTNEFLAGRDTSFRPVGLETGPDGALYLLDMQRDVIEHPDYIPAKLRDKLDVRAGQDRGRIYRIMPKGGLKSPPVNLAKMSDTELVRQLGSANQWQRLTAQRLLVERQARGTAAALRETVVENPRALARLHALWTLRGLGELRAADVRRGLADTHPGVRENALWLAEPFLSANPALAEAVLALTRDTVPRVRFVAAQIAGAVDLPAAAGALGDLLLRDADSRWTRLAVLSSLAPRSFLSVWERVASREVGQPPATNGRLEVLRELAELAAARAGADVEAFWAAFSGPEASWSSPARTAVWEGLAAGLARSGVRLELTKEKFQLFGRRFSLAVHGDESAAPSGAEQSSRRAIEPPRFLEETRALMQLTQTLGLPLAEQQFQLLEYAALAAADPAKSVAQRQESIRLLGLGNGYLETTTNALFRLLDAREPREVQQAALGELRRFKEPEIGVGLVARWRAIGPALRPALLNVLLERRAFHDSLLNALEAGSISVGELNLDLEQRRRLLRGGTAEIRERAAKFMGDEEYSNRKTLVEEWLAKLPARGDLNRGRKFFEEACARCHVSGPVGKRVGPDLTGMAHRSVEDLLSNILDPNMAINPGFVAYTVEAEDGESVTGLLGAETSEAVTLLLADEQQMVLPRRTIRKLQADGRSLMPEGLEAGRTPQDLRDLIAFLQGIP